MIIHHNLYCNPMSVLRTTWEIQYLKSYDLVRTLCCSPLVT